MNDSIRHTTDDTDYTEKIATLYRTFFESFYTASSESDFEGERLTVSSLLPQEYEGQKKLENEQSGFARELFLPMLNNEFRYEINTRADILVGRYSESDFEETLTASSSLGRDYAGEEQLVKEKKLFANELISLIRNEEFEYGIDTKADVLVRRYMELNPLLTKEWLNTIFVDNFADVFILVALLRIIARLDYTEIYPQGQTMALAVLSHENTEVKECGVRAFESWGTVHSLKILENLTVGIQWLQEYIDDVVSDLREEYDVLAH